MRKIAVIIGSLSDLQQCGHGLHQLAKYQAEGSAQVFGVYIRSQHRNTLETQELLKELVNVGVDAIVVGAGWANHLTGCCDAFLRYTLRNNSVRVIGVAFRDESQARRTQAAVLSITEVPGTQVAFEDYIGADGFYRACQKAAQGELGVIKLPEPKPAKDFRLEEAVSLSCE